MIGSASTPIRASSLDDLYSCELFWLLRHMDDYGSSTAAETGTACHRAIELWHTGRSLREALVQTSMESTEEPRPFAGYDEDTTARLVTAYTDDPRNHPREHVVAQELTVRLVLEPHPWDKTQAPIHISGRIDQIRGTGGLRRLWDIKTSTRTGEQILNSAAMQQAAYLVALQTSEWAPVHAGGIIRLRGYAPRKSTPPEECAVFFAYDLTIDAARALLDSIRLKVAALRAGEACISPGDWCRGCPDQSPGQCLRRIT